MYGPVLDFALIVYTGNIHKGRKPHKLRLCWPLPCRGLYMSAHDELCTKICNLVYGRERTSVRPNRRKPGFNSPVPISLFSDAMVVLGAMSLAQCFLCSASRAAVPAVTFNCLMKYSYATAVCGLFNVGQ